MSDTKKLRFANNHVEGGDTFEQGQVYEVPVADARHYVRIGKAVEVAPNTKTAADRAAEERGKAATKDSGKTATKSDGKTAAATEDGGTTAADTK